MGDDGDIQTTGWMTFCKKAERVRARRNEGRAYSVENPDGGVFWVYPGDWEVEGDNGSRHRCTASTFERTYERAPDEP